MMEKYGTNTKKLPPTKEQLAEIEKLAALQGPEFEQPKVDTFADAETWIGRLQDDSSM